MEIFESKIKVRVLDIDENHRLTTKGLIGYLQEVAGMHSDIAGYGLNDIPQTNLTWLVLNWKIKVFTYPFFNTTLTIKTWARIITKTHSYRDFEVYDDNNNLIAIATSKWVLVNAKTKSICRITDEIRDAYSYVEKSVFPIPMDEKVKAPEDSSFVYDYTIQRRDIDTNHHVNNLYYLDFAYEALPEEAYNCLNCNTTEIIYKKEIKYKEKINCYYSFIDNKHIITIKNANSNIVHSIITIYNN